MDTENYAVSKPASSCWWTVIFLCHNFVLDLTDYIIFSHDHWSIESISCYRYPCSACPSQTVLCFSSAASCLSSTGSPLAPKVMQQSSCSQECEGKTFTQESQNLLVWNLGSPVSSWSYCRSSNFNFAISQLLQSKLSSANEFFFIVCAQ